MATDLGTMELQFRARLDQLDKEMAKAKSKAGKAADDMGDEMERRMGAKMQGVGVSMTKTVTPAALALGAAFKKADEEWGDGSDSIISKTGATGDALKSLEGSMANVGKGVRTGLGDIGGVVGDINTALGVTGKPLEDLTTRVVKLQELGESFDAMSFTRFMGDWTIATEDGGAALDKLYKTAQVTGIGVGELMEKATQFGAPMRALGFDVDTTTALLGKWTKEGVNVETVLASMKSALGKFAKAGEDPKQSLQNLIATMQGFETDAEAMALAAELVGVKTGPDLAMAIREGRFDIDELSASLAGATGSIDSAYQATIGWTDKLSMLKNRVFAVIGPVGQVGMGIAGIAAGAGPMIAGVGMMIGPLMGFAVAAWAAVAPLLPWMLAIAAVIAIGVLLWKNWDTIKEKVGQAVGAVTGFLSDLLASVVGFVQEWGILLLGPIGAIWKFRDQIGETLGNVVGFFLALPGRIIDALSSLAGRLWDTAWEAMTRMSVAIADKAGEIISWLGELPGKIIGALGDLGRMLWDAGWKIMLGLKDGIVAGLGVVKDFVAGIAGKIISWKGPLSYDKTMLVPAGRAIMDSLVAGLRDHEGELVRQLAHVTGLVQGTDLSVASLGHSADAGAGGGSSSSGQRPINVGPFYVKENDLPTEIPRRLRGALHLWDR